MDRLQHWMWQHMTMSLRPSGCSATASCWASSPTRRGSTAASTTAASRSVTNLHNLLPSPLSFPEIWRDGSSPGVEPGVPGQDAGAGVPRQGRQVHGPQPQRHPHRQLRRHLQSGQADVTDDLFVVLCMPSLLLSKQLNRANTCQVWRKSDWSCVKTFPCHSDSVWDLKLHNTTVVRRATRDTRDTWH